MEEVGEDEARISVAGLEPVVMRKIPFGRTKGAMFRPSTPLLTLARTARPCTAASRGSGPGFDRRPCYSMIPTSQNRTWALKTAVAISNTIRAGGGFVVARRRGLYGGWNSMRTAMAIG